MGESKIISIKEIRKDNPILCLLPLRYFGKCYQCERYKKCDSKLTNPEGERILNRREEIKKQIKMLESELKDINSNMR